MNTTLLIMAAGIGSRFGTGIKQLEPVDDAGHIIMDYSIHDAIEAGFNHVVFIIRKDIENEFKKVIGDRIAAICSSHNVTVDYAFQDINDIPGTLPEGRTKPWGTGQAVLAAKKVIKTPFIVINADDYYGKEGFKAVHEYLVNGGKSCMAGFVLKNTLSDNGGVTRGICKMDEQNNLTEVMETKNIVKTADGAEADGVAVDVNSLVSMNMWGLTPDFLDVLEKGFKEFFEKEVPGNPLKAEYLIPIFIGELLEQGKMSVKVLKTNDTWYGMTYHEDVAAVKDSFKKMLENGVYNYRPERKDWKLDLRVNELTELEIFAEENPPKRVNRPEACGLRHLAFCVDSVEQTVKELGKLGIECEPIRVDDYTGKKMTFFHDPDGLPLELHE